MDIIELGGIAIVIVLQLLGLYAQHRNKDAWELGTKTLNDALNRGK